MTILEMKMDQLASGCHNGHPNEVSRLSVQKVVAIDPSVHLFEMQMDQPASSCLDGYPVEVHTMVIEQVVAMDAGFELLD